MHFHIKSEADYKEILNSVFELSNGRKIWLFTGDLGAGKTTMIQEILKHLGSAEKVTSPTFSLVNEYIYPKGKVYHMDLYRLKDPEEAIHIGLMEYIDSGSYCFIEWPEIASTLFDEDSFKINIEILDLNERKINLH